MKYSYREMPLSMKGTYGEFSRNFGFDWKEFVLGIPSPLFLVTTYKSNGQPNACMQSWAAFTSANHGNGYYALLSSVNKNGHLSDARFSYKLFRYSLALMPTTFLNTLAKCAVSA